MQNPDGTWQRDAAGNFVRNPALVDPTPRRSPTSTAPRSRRSPTGSSAAITARHHPHRDAGRREPARRRDRRRAAGLHQRGRRADRADEPRRHPRRPDRSRTPPAARRPARSPTASASPCSRSTTWSSPRPSPARSSRTCWSSSSSASRGRPCSGSCRCRRASPTPTTPRRRSGAKVSNMALNGTPIDPAATYRVTTNDFLANGGDGFTNLTAGTGRVTAPGLRRRRARRVPRRRRAGRARPGQPDHQDRLISGRVRRRAERRRTPSPRLASHRSGGFLADRSGPGAYSAT